MDRPGRPSSAFSCLTPEVMRLASFQFTPLPNEHELSISNSPAKLAKAGFMRRTSASYDDVCCESCGAEYGDWSGESPFAVHRVLNENCSILNNASAANDMLQHPSVVCARRQLFPVEESDTSNGIDGNIEREELNPVDDARNEQVDGEENEAVDTRSRNVFIFIYGCQNVLIQMQNNDEQTTKKNHAANSSRDAEPGNNTDTDRPELSYRPQRMNSSLMSPKASYSFPFEPPVGGFPMLFASRRLQTFSDTRCPECIAWAEEGFVYRLSTHDMQCVFCTLILPFSIECEPKKAHAQSIHCPRVLLIDVGNISTLDEECIRMKYLQRQLRANRSRDRHFKIWYPQFEDENARLGTYDNWPHRFWDDDLQSSSLSRAGFFFTGSGDKVKCYWCGVGVYRWQPGSDPWEQHALHMPTCPHLTVKGQHFIEQAAQAQVLTEVDIPSDSGNSSSLGLASSSTGELLNSPLGLPTLDAAAVRGALSTSRYPNTEILLGMLRAADDNFTPLCMQSRTDHRS